MILTIIGARFSQTTGDDSISLDSFPLAAQGDSIRTSMPEQYTQHDSLELLRTDTIIHEEGHSSQYSM